MSKLDPRFNSLNFTNISSNEMLFDKSIKKLNSSQISNQIDTENTKKFQVSLSKMANGISLLEEYRRKNEEINELFDDNSKTNTEKVNQSKYLSTDTTMTPTHSRNPNIKVNKLADIKEVSANQNIQTDPSLMIEPSPSGITRVYIKYDDEEDKGIKNNELKASKQQNDVEYQPKKVLKTVGTVDSGTSPFVLMSSKLIPNSNQLLSNPVDLKAESLLQKIKMIKSVDPMQIINEDDVVLQNEKKQKEKQTHLEKSKLVIVNLTPKSENTFKHFNNIHFPNDANEMKEKNINEFNTENFLNPKKVNFLKDIETPVIASMIKSNNVTNERKKTIEEDSEINFNSNDLLNRKSLNYYDNILKNKNSLKENESEFSESFYNPTVKNDNQTKTILCKDQMIQFPTPIEKPVNQSRLINITNDLAKTSYLNRFKMEAIEENEESTKKSLETFYDGKKSWTIAIEDLMHSSTYNKQQDVDDIDKGTKKNLHVKINVPEDSIIRRKKTRKCQTFCLIFFILVILVLALAILIYFIGYSKMGREKILFEINEQIKSFIKN